LSENIPNASVINTSEISGIANQLIKGLLVLVFAVSLPPLVLSLFLILTLILSLFNSRKRDAVQLLALGSTKSFVRTLYVKESVSGTLFIAILSYVVGVLIVFLISRFYLKINHFTFFDQELVYGLFAIIGAVFILAYFLWYSDKKSIKELLLEK
jgi:predicted lysophospholipase L1 biosynthesis ABC-type transport system permease subunit